MDSSISYEDKLLLEESNLAWLGESMQQAQRREFQNSRPMGGEPNHLPNIGSSTDNTQLETNAGESLFVDQQSTVTQNGTPANESVSESHAMEEALTKNRRRKGDPEPDYSELSRRKVQKNKRTGQACDRCKVCLAFDVRTSPVRFACTHPYPHSSELLQDILTKLSGSASQAQMRLRTRRLHDLFDCRPPMPGD